MIIRGSRFNTYLLAALAVILVCGCASTHKKQVSSFRMHVEVNADASKRSQSISVYREQPFNLTVEKEPFLSEKNVAEAKVIDTMGGGYAISLRFDREGTWLLNSYSTANRGLHFAVFIQWCEKPGAELNKGRWLAAPKVTRPITDGVFTFTPDATREEADEIVAGLSNVAKQLKTASESNW